MVSMLTAILRGAVIVLFTATCAEAKATVNNQVTLLEETNSSLLRYPTQFTQNIVPKNIHSHNDYWRDVPLLTALSYGVGSVEADVWLVNGTLYVGHEVAALTQDRTFASLYVQPLVKIIQGQNPKNVLTANQTQPNGVWDTASGTALQLLVDIKTDGVTTLPWVLEALQPLRSQGFLTTYANGSLSTGPVTVVGTGNSPLEPIKALEPRDYFFDAPLTQLRDPSLNTTWDFTLSPLASTDYGTAVGWSGIGDISEAQRTNITKFVDDAHSFGIKARFWDTPGWPIQARDNVWRELVNDGADWLNADDLEAASQF
ncbi:hypothetical protein GLOTRDRAFT_90125 [Gloeophyllum trabeum ATCC 11539]|uniref:Altered inheritance of mitochondria protein 6 n=1 Tax=Gloeophyllum trabeum (strain ATCC 11539 / FP-39264 / Madison 617) TaxID=670483 RepID=S7S4A0_GLOTA|nr:uncharacterized protein GLOTRDRAFT_90125 [Gloeophyllum trabeum ATCC 11539]EPQ60709.1 hypothetical protein GLOTRDRAFT_90125 [Gloeophyllum trabeum ATCC 11539]